MNLKIIFIVLIFALITPTLSIAEEDDNIAKAQCYYDNGITALADKNYDLAIKAFTYAEEFFRLGDDTSMAVNSLKMQKEARLKKADYYYDLATKEVGSASTAGAPQSEHYSKAMEYYQIAAQEYFIGGNEAKSNDCWKLYDSMNVLISSKITTTNPVNTNAQTNNSGLRASDNADNHVDLFGVLGFVVFLFVGIFFLKHMTETFPKNREDRNRYGNFGNDYSSKNTYTFYAETEYGNNKDNTTNTESETYKEHAPPRKKGKAIFKNMSGQEFEEFCVEFLKSLGYINVKKTRHTGDRGKDIEAEVELPTGEKLKYIVQCKNFSDNKITPKLIRELNGAKTNSEKCIFITSSDYTEQALDEAREKGVKTYAGYEIVREFKRADSKAWEACEEKYG